MDTHTKPRKAVSIFPTNHPCLLVCTSMTRNWPLVVNRAMAESPFENSAQ